MSNHCECDVARAKHAIYLLPINGQAAATTGAEEETTKRAAIMLQRAQRAPEWVSVEKRVGQSIKAAIGRGARGQQIGRFIKRVSG